MQNISSYTLDRRFFIKLLLRINCQMESIKNCNRALILITSFYLCNGYKVQMIVDTNRPIQVINPLSPSVAMGLGIFEYGWVDYFNDTKFMNLAKAYAPMYLRVGGTKADYTYYEPDEIDYSWKRSNERLSNQTEVTRNFRDQCQSQDRNGPLFEAHRDWAFAQQRQYDQALLENREVLEPIQMTGSAWRKLNEFCQCVGWRLIFDLNLLNRNGSMWNSSNAETLINFTESRYHIDWELGNEPNSYMHSSGIRLSPEQIGNGFLRLKSLLSYSSWWNSSMIFGPDANRIGAKSAKIFLDKFVRTAGNVINGLTFHHYYLNGKTATEEQYLDPKTLNSLIRKIQQVKNVASRSPKKPPLWLGETASAYGGGAPGLSNTFLDGFTWLDKLGMTSRMGVDMVVRQSFIQSQYDLVDENFNPLPDYWLTLLYKRLVGNKVLNVILKKCTNSQCILIKNGHVRVYAHCTNSRNSSYRRGSVVLYFINLRRRSSRLSIFPFNNVNLKGDFYLLQPSIPRNLTSNQVLLNGQILRLTNSSTIPPLSPRRLHYKAFVKGILIPSRSYGFLVIKNANAHACLN